MRVHTDAGITGLGESGAWGFLEASQAAIEKFGRYLIGKDPLQIEHHWQYMYRWSAFRGSAIMGAISALDIALWDIAGKHFDAPVYQLLGGKVRHRARVYHHIYGSTIEDHLEEIDRVVAQGFTALGHLNPLLDEPIEQPYERTHADLIDGAIDNVRRYREAVATASISASRSTDASPPPRPSSSAAASSSTARTSLKTRPAPTTSTPWR